MQDDQRDEDDANAIDVIGARTPGGRFVIQSPRDRIRSNHNCFVRIAGESRSLNFRASGNLEVPLDFFSVLADLHERAKISRRESPGPKATVQRS